MSRKVAYRKRVMFLDIFLTLFTGGIWLIVVGFRELRQHNS